MIGPEPFLGTICNKFVLIKYDALGFYYLAVIGFMYFMSSLESTNLILFINIGGLCSMKCSSETLQL